MRRPSAICRRWRRKIFESQSVQYYLAISALQQGKMEDARRLLQELEPSASRFYPAFQILLSNLAILHQEWPKVLNVYQSILAPRPHDR